MNREPIEISKLPYMNLQTPRNATYTVPDMSKKREKKQCLRILNND